jgi:hypothetical protein
MKFMKRTVGCTKWDKKILLMELKTESITHYIKYYQENWTSHGNRMDAGRFPKAILRYRPQGKRSIGRPMKRWGEN